MKKIKKIKKIITSIFTISVMLTGSINSCFAEEDKISLPEETTFVYGGVEYPFEVLEDGTGLLVIQTNDYWQREADFRVMKGQFKCRGKVLHRGSYEYANDLEYNFDKEYLDNIEHEVLVDLNPSVDINKYIELIKQNHWSGFNEFLRDENAEYRCWQQECYEGIGKYKGKLVIMLCAGIGEPINPFVPNQAGDIDGDYGCDLTDVQSILKFALRIEECPVEVDADINKDDIVDLRDVQLALKCALKIDDIENYRPQLG